MRFLRFLIPVLLLVPAFWSCNKDLNVNAAWTDVTVVYGLLDQSKDTNYIKITKAFLGEGNALQFAKVPDSSTYPDKLEVRLDEYDGSNLRTSYPLDTITIHNKQAGDSVFYYPDQLMYFTLARLNQSYTYKLFIRNRTTGKEITSQTPMVHDFEIIRPTINASFPPGKNFEVTWQTGRNGNGSRFQLVIRFCYLEALKSNKDSLYMQSIDWLVFNNVSPANISASEIFDLFLPSDVFYVVVGNKVDTNSNVDRRIPNHCEYIFTAAAPDLSTYMDVTAPSLGLIQERPAFTNIVNGIGLFSARYTKSVDTLGISNITIEALKVNPNTSDLKFVSP